MIKLTSVIVISINILSSSSFHNQLYYVRFYNSSHPQLPSWLGLGRPKVIFVLWVRHRRFSKAKIILRHGDENIVLNMDSKLCMHDKDKTEIFIQLPFFTRFAKACNLPFYKEKGLCLVC